MNENNLKLERLLLGRIIFLFYFLALLLRFYQNVTPSGMLQPVLYRYNFDYTYWLFDIFGIYKFVLNSKTGSIFFDFLLFSSCLLSFLYPLKHYFAIFFGAIFFVYAICYNTVIVHHSHPMSLMTLAIVPFFFKNLFHWRMLWEGFRYFVCYAYFMSFIWKALIGKSLFFWEMGINSTKANLIEYLYHFADTNLAEIFRFFISHPTLLNIGLIIVFLLEGLMLIGFFTKRLDYILFWIPVIIHFSTYLFSDVYFFEMLVGVFVFISFNSLMKLASAKEFLSR